MKKIWQLRVQDEFSGAHYLRHYEGKCEKLHGHNFSVEICVQGIRLQKDTELLLDFKYLKRILKTILQELDHNLLNETPPFDSINPTSENLAQYIFKEFEKALDPASQANIASVTVCEKPGQSATYMEISA